MTHALTTGKNATREDTRRETRKLEDIEGQIMLLQAARRANEHNGYDTDFIDRKLTAAFEEHRHQMARVTTLTRLRAAKALTSLPA